MIFKKNIICLIMLTLFPLYTIDTNSDQYFTSKEITQSINNDVEKNNISITPSTVDVAIKKIESSGFICSGITGISVCLSPNLGYFIGRQYPTFDITYKSPGDTYKIKRFYANIHSIGAKFALALNLNLIFFLDTTADFYEQNSIIELDKGIEIELITYAPFKNIPGALLIFHIPFGFSIALSMVTGGKIKISDITWDLNKKAKT